MPVTMVVFCFAPESLLFILATHFLSSSLTDPWTKSVPHQFKKTKYKGCGQDSGGPELVKKNKQWVPTSKPYLQFHFQDK